MNNRWIGHDADRNSDLGVIERALTARTRQALDELLVQGSAGADEPVLAKTAAYKLTLLKKLSQSTRPSKIKETITDLLGVQDLYRGFLPILCTLDLNHEGIRYYAHSVIKSEIFQMTRGSSEDRYLHLIAFITHQYFRLHDNLLDVLLNVLQTYLNTAQREHKERSYRRREHWNETVRKLVGYLDHSFLKIYLSLSRSPIVRSSTMPRRSARFGLCWRQRSQIGTRPRRPWPR